MTTSKEGGGVGETLRNYQGGVQPILTIPYRGGGRGVQKSKKLPYVIYERPLTQCSLITIREIEILKFMKEKVFNFQDIYLPLELF